MGESFVIFHRVLHGACLIMSVEHLSDRQQSILVWQDYSYTIPLQWGWTYHWT
jgi:hypothetical protein